MYFTSSSASPCCGFAHSSLRIEENVEHGKIVVRAEAAPGGEPDDDQPPPPRRAPEKAPVN